MNYMTELSAIAKAHGGIIETKIAAQRGISKAMLYKLCKENKIHRIVKGQYILPDDIQDELLAISNRSNKVIFSHETALYLHGISDRHMDVEVRLPLLGGDGAGAGCDLVVAGIGGGLVSKLFPVEDAEGHLADGTDAADAAQPDLFGVAQGGDGGKDLLAAVDAQNVSGTEFAILHNKTSCIRRFRDGPSAAAEQRPCPAGQALRRTDGSLRRGRSAACARHGRCGGWGSPPDGPAGRPA